MHNLPLPEIVRIQDAKIQAFLDGQCPLHFWYASCWIDGTPAERVQRLHALGFDNYPTAHIPAVEALQPHLFFFERMAGAEVESPDGQAGDFFHSWCRPLLCDNSTVLRFSAAWESSPLWHAYEKAICAYLRDTPAEERLPVMFPGLSPLDMACNLCGTESFFLLLYEEPEAAEHLLNAIVSLMIDAHRRLRELGARLVSPFGFPGVYCNDLQLPYLSPSLITRFLLPCYSRLATACGGLMPSLLSPDEGAFQAALSIDGVLGCLIDKRLPFATIKTHLGRKLFLIPHYCFDDVFDRPTLHNGTYYNPIVQSYSRELPEIYCEFVTTHNLLITIDRPTLAEVCGIRERLLG